jgi:hypothetical protein
METHPLPDSDENTRLLRFAVMCSGTVFAQWEARCIKKLLALGNVHLVLLIMDDRPTHFFAKVRKARLHQVLSLIHRRVLSRPPALRQKDMTHDLTGVPRIRCQVLTRGKYSEYFSKDDIEKIREFDLDFILRFGFNIIRGDILHAARYGVWSFHHDDETKYRGGPPCFWEIYNDDPITGAILQRLTDRLNSGIVLKKSFFPTINYSYSANLNRVYLDSANWPAQVCIDILNDNAQYLDAAPSSTKAPIYYAPNNLQMIHFLLKLSKNLLVKVGAMLFCHEE